LQISALPSLPELQRWQKAGVGYLLNVSGVNLFDIYPEDQLACFSITQVAFADVFTTGSAIGADAVELISNEAYLQVTTEDQRQALLTAVQALISQLQKCAIITVFCHRGQGRSPLVVAAAFQQFYREPIHQAIARTRALHRPALFTDVSLSALQWCLEQAEA
jgi:hypothetical protein